MPIELHFHKKPACSGAQHDASCSPLGEEEACFEFKEELAGWCLCTHYQPEKVGLKPNLKKVSPILVRLPGEKVVAVANKAQTMITGIEPGDLRAVIEGLPETPLGPGKCQLIKRKHTPGGGWSVGCAGTCSAGICPRNPLMWMDAQGKVGLRCACLKG